VNPPAYCNLVSLHHPIQGESVRDAAGRRLTQHALEFPTELRYVTQPQGALRTVGLLLNGVSLNGVPAVHFERYYAGVRTSNG